MLKLFDYTVASVPLHNVLDFCLITLYPIHVLRFVLCVLRSQHSTNLFNRKVLRRLLHIKYLKSICAVHANTDTMDPLYRFPANKYSNNILHNIDD